MEPSPTSPVSDTDQTTASQHPTTRHPTREAPPNIADAAQLVWRQRSGSMGRGGQPSRTSGALSGGTEGAPGDSERTPLMGGRPSKGEGLPTTMTPSPTTHAARVGYRLRKGGSSTEQLLAMSRAKRLGLMVWLTCFNMPYGFAYATLALYVLPAEAVRLWPQQESLFLGLSVTMIGLTQFLSPVFGTISDRYYSPFGKRRPFIFIGGLLTAACFLGMWFASLMYMRVLWLVFLSLMSGCSNIIYSAQTGLIPDQLPDEQSQGTSSGIVAVHLLTGSTLGSLFVGYTKNMDFHVLYFVYTVMIFVSCVLVCLAAIEDYSEAWPRGPCLLPADITCRDILKSFVIDRNAHPDFFWIFVARTLYYLAISGQSFILYYLRDVIGTTDEPTRKFQISVIALLGQMAAAAVAFPAGYLSEYSGRKILVYFACFLMSLTWVIFLVLPWTTDEHSALVASIFVCAVVYGVGNGAYLSVDLALALDCLPDRKTAAKDLGIWGVSAFIGSTIGPLIEGLALQLIGMGGIVGPQRIAYAHFSYAGYVAVLGFSSFTMSLSGWFISFVKQAR